MKVLADGDNSAGLDDSDMEALMREIDVTHDGEISLAVRRHSSSLQHRSSCLILSSSAALQEWDRFIEEFGSELAQAAGPAAGLR